MRWFAGRASEKNGKGVEDDAFISAFFFWVASLTSGKFSLLVEKS